MKQHGRAHTIVFFASRARRVIYLAALLLTVFPLKIYPQDEPAEEVVRVRTDLATVAVYATDRRGRRVSGLQQGDFLLFDGPRPLPVEHFANGAERVALCFLLDASGSARDIIQNQRETALALFSRFGQGSRLSVIRFGEKAQTLTTFTEDVAVARRAFLAPPSANGFTAIFDGALAALREFARNETRPAERRIVILISDGLDNASRAKAGEVIAEAQKAGVSFYVLHLPLYTPDNGRLVARSPTKGFKDLAEKTGGRYFRVGTAQDALNPRVEYNLRPVFQSLADDLASQYILGSYPRDGRRPDFKVELIPAKRGSFRVHIIK